MRNLRQVIVIGAALIWLIFLSIFISCGEMVEKKQDDYERKQSKQLIDDLQDQVAALTAFASTYASGLNNPFSDCESLTDALESKICKIAQTIGDSKSMEIKVPLQDLAKGFQVELFGPDCTNATDPGCPVAGSTVAKLKTAEDSINNHNISLASINNQIISANTSISVLITRLTTLENRLNNFNGSGRSIETLISGLQSDVAILQSDVSGLKKIIESSRTLQEFDMCGDNPDSGPIYEMVLIAGDRTKVYGSTKVGSKTGPALIFAAGDTDKGFTTSLNSKTCNFKIYNNLTKTKVQACWVVSNRLATTAQIDAARTANTASCTPY
jgi:hypothetical protein